ncbi:MAG: endonuclease domain-containing protein [Nitriliruptoraceae bacterium]
MDLSGDCTVPALTELVVAALQTDPQVLARLETVLAQNPSARGRRNLRAARAALGAEAGRIRSEIEVVAARELIAAGLPRPELGFPVLDASGRLIAVLDLAYPDHRVAIEIDGFNWHRSPAQKLADERRQNQLVLAAWTVLRFSASEVRHHPRNLVEVVRAALEIG